MNSAECHFRRRRQPVEILDSNINIEGYLSVTLSSARSNSLQERLALCELSLAFDTLFFNLDSEENVNDDTKKYPEVTSSDPPLFHPLVFC